MGRRPLFCSFMIGLAFLSAPYSALMGAQYAQETQQACCGPDCDCGCAEGHACNCHSTDSDPNYFNLPEKAPGCLTQEPFWSRIDLDYEGLDSQIARSYGASGIWLPEDPPLFRPAIANPREVNYSVGWRFNDQVFNKNLIDVSYGDLVPLYRWFNVWPWGGDLEIDLEGSLWALFDPLHESSPLINADYYIGVPISYAIDNWAFRLRGYHISSHIGDEFLLNHPLFHRRNPSAEYLDFFASWYLTNELRFIGGIGYIVHMDESFKFRRFYAEGGAELRLSRLGFYSCKDSLFGQPIMGMYFRWNRSFKHCLDQTYILGYEFGKTTGLKRKLRMFLQYHDGFSLEGQFSKERTNYFSIRLTYGF